MGLIGMVAGGVAGWFLSRRGSASSDHDEKEKSPASQPLLTEAVQETAAAPGTADEMVIDLRDSQVVTTLQSELRRARSRIERLQRSNADLEAAVRRKEQAVVEARNTLLAVQHSLAEDQAKKSDAVDSPSPTQTSDVIRSGRVGDFPPDDGFGDIQNRLRAVTGELAEVNRRHQKGQ